MKQIDRIHNMNAEELAKKIVQRPSPCDFCEDEDGITCWYADTRKCIKQVKAWLESEVEEDDRT